MDERSLDVARRPTKTHIGRSTPRASDERAANREKHLRDVDAANIEIAFEKQSQLERQALRTATQDLEYVAHYSVPQSAALAGFSRSVIEGPVGPARKSETSSRRSVADDDLGRQLTAGFTEAVQAAIRLAHESGHAVAGFENGVAVEHLPDGTIRRIDDVTTWSPTDWCRRG